MERFSSFCNHERFLDLGAYSGDTIEQFLQHVIRAMRHSMP